MSWDNCFERVFYCSGYLVLIACFLCGTLFVLSQPASAIEINPSVDNQPFLCKYSITRWICEMQQGDPGIRGVNGTQGPQGLPNFSAIYYNASNFTTSQNASTFINATNFTSNSNYTVFEGGTFYNGTINESYAYLPGRAGGQLLQGGIASTDALTLNGSANNGVVKIQQNGGNVIIGNVTPPTTYKFGIYNGIYRLMTLYSSGTSTTFDLFNGTKANLNIRLDATGAGAQSYFFGGPWNLGTPTEYYNSANYGRQYIGQQLSVGITAATATAQLDTTGSVRFRNCSGTPTFDAGGNMTCLSDEKYKTAITPYVNGVTKLQSLTPKQYKWSASSGFDTTKINVGFSAQDVQAVYPECVIARDDVTYVQDTIKDKDGGMDEFVTREVKIGTQTLALDDKCLIAVLWNAAKSLDVNNTAQQVKINSLEARLTALEKGLVKV